MQANNSQYQYQNILKVPRGNVHDSTLISLKEFKHKALVKGQQLIFKMLSIIKCGNSLYRWKSEI